MRTLIILALLLVPIALSGCGKKGQLEIPPAEPASESDGS